MRQVNRLKDVGLPKRFAIPFAGVMLTLYLIALNSGGFKQGTLDFTMVAVLTIAMNIWLYRDLWRRVWFWLTIGAFGIIHAVAILTFSLPPLLVGSGNGGAGVLAFLLFDSFFVYWFVGLAERAALGWPKTIEVACRVCGEYVDKNASQCPHCGTWKPAPISDWAFLIALAPVFLLLVFMLFLIPDKH